jgi:hypothetical protein
VKLKNEIRQGKAQGGTKENENKDQEATVFLQRRIRGILARKYVERMRDEEMEFLGMCPRKKTTNEMLNDPMKKMNDTM